MNIVLFEPDIPINVGAIGRIAVVTNSTLHLIRPYGFIMNEKHMKKAGLDYWAQVKLKEYNSLEDFLAIQGDEHLYLVTTKGQQRYDQIKYPPDSFFLYGKESKGLPSQLLKTYADSLITIPMGKDQRSLNLSVSVGITIYEASRQHDFQNMTNKMDHHFTLGPN